MGDQSEAMASIIWLYQTVDAQKEEVFFPDLLITLRRHEEPPAILSGTPELGWAPLSCGMASYQQILANIGSKNSIWILN